MVDAHEGSWFGGEFGGQPVGEAVACPVFAATGWRVNFDGGLGRSGRVNSQTGQAACGSLGARIVDAEVAFKKC